MIENHQNENEAFLFKPFITKSLATMTMNRFYRLIKPTVVSSSFRDGRILKPYHTVPSAAAVDEELKHINADDESGSEPYNFSIVNKSLARGCEPNNFWVNKEASSFQILGSGMILLKNYISLIGQVDMVNICQDDFCVPGAFKVPTNQYGTKLRLRMMSLGRNWDPTTGYKNPCRSDGSEPPPIPLGFRLLAQSAIEDAQHLLDGDELPSVTPDTCIVNFYASGGRLGLHQDCDESSDSLRRGLPVVSVSIGDPAEFWYGHIRDENKLSKVLLESGDVLIFGGKSRLIFHGLKKIVLGGAPEIFQQATRMNLGRLNLTLRQV